MAMRPVAKADYWACACVRHRKGVLVWIKLHHPDQKRCRVCKCQRPERLDEPDEKEAMVKQ